MIAAPLKTLATPEVGVGAQLALFLDFDGTLVELAETPDRIVVPSDLPTELGRLKGRLGGALAIVTGRPLEALDRFMRPVVLPAAAAHGTQRRRSDGSLVEPPAPIAAGAVQIATWLRPLVRSEPDLVLEEKPGAVALHYRQAPELEARCRAAMRQAVAAVQGFELVRGKMVVEARPAGIDKGAAIRRFMDEPPFRARTPVFFGDDRTDEDGFAAVGQLGGLAVKVGAGDTLAPYRLADVGAMRRLLRDLAASTRPAEQLAEILASSETRHPA